MNSLRLNAIDSRTSDLVKGHSTTFIWCQFTFCFPSSLPSVQSENGEVRTKFVIKTFQMKSLRQRAISDEPTAFFAALALVWLLSIHGLGAWHEQDDDISLCFAVRVQDVCDHVSQLQSERTFEMYYHRQSIRLISLDFSPIFRLASTNLIQLTCFNDCTSI
jgi:hypothetical protein